MELFNNSVRAKSFSEQITGIKGVSLKIAYLRTIGLKLELIEYTHRTKNIFSKLNQNKLGHICFNVSGIEEFYGKNKSEIKFIIGPTLIPSGPNMGGLMTYFFDIDNNKIELIEPPNSSFI